MGTRGTFVGIAIVSLMLAGAAVGQTSRPAGGNGVLSLDDLFALLDTNHDGRISRDEATGVYAQRFARWDAANRGYATRADIRADRAAHGIGDDGRRLRSPTTRRSTAQASWLQAPADWRLEQAPVPPVFAPNVGITGTDETRFAPGMYTTSSPDYFTYAKAMAIDGELRWTTADVATFMDRYYRGLTASRARRSKPSTRPVGDDRSTAEAGPATQGESRFVAAVPFVDAFTDNRKVMLRVELHLIPQPALNKTYAVMLVSPSSPDSPTWTKLREVGHHAEARMAGPTTRP